MKSFNEWFVLRENVSNTYLNRITLHGTGGNFKFKVKDILSGIRSERFYVDLRGVATMTGAATSASGRINHTLGGLDNKQITRHDPTEDPNATNRYGFEPTNQSIQKPGTISIEISIDDFKRDNNRKYPSMHFNSEWTNWKTQGIEGIDKVSAITLVDLINQELRSGPAAGVAAQASERATRNDSRKRTINISVDDLGFHQKIS